MKALNLQDCNAIRAEYDAGKEVKDIMLIRQMSRDQIYLRLRAAGTKFRRGGPKAAAVGSTHIVRGYVKERVADDWPYLAQMRTNAGDGRNRNWIFQHRKVMAEHLNRPLTSNESVHHIDGNKTNNDVDNLQLMQAHPHGGRYRCNCCGSENISAISLQ